ncbi:MAG: hypothetical protein LBH05_03105 [Deferribacteraceae bacterium]|jgi:hypothetical protein|nr:hypothetical protein [Deferribacteraceae bacterium]
MLYLKRLLILLFLLFPAYPVNAGEIESTGSARIIKGDVRSAQKSSLNSALLGGIHKYLRQVSPNRSESITNDHFGFINSYKILRRELRGDDILTTVRIDIDDIIAEETMGNVAAQFNTAVFLASGVPNYVNNDQARQTISSVFSANHFTTKNQLKFEQELIDRSNLNDIQTAFQSVSAQYLFDIKFTLKNYKSGESCELICDSSYTSVNNISKSVPILRTESTVEDKDLAGCILTAIRLSTETMLSHTRKHFVSLPGIKADLKQYELRFKGAGELKIINSIIDMLKKRKYLTEYEMTEFFYDEAIFDVSFYFSTEEFAQKLRASNINGVEDIEYDDNSVTVILNSGAVY